MLFDQSKIFTRSYNDLQDRRFIHERSHVTWSLIYLSRERRKPFVTIAMSSREKRRCRRACDTFCHARPCRLGILNGGRPPLAIKWPWNCSLSGLWQYKERSGNGDRWSQQLSVLLRRSYVAFSVSRAARVLPVRRRCEIISGRDQRLLRRSFSSCTKKAAFLIFLLASRRPSPLHSVLFAREENLFRSTAGPSSRSSAMLRAVEIAEGST